MECAFWEQLALSAVDILRAKRELSLMRWELIPSWVKHASIGHQTINARVETAAAKPAFGEPLRKRRCLIPADGFYEWKLGKGDGPNPRASNCAT